MSKYAVIQISGKQHKVMVGETIEIDSQDLEAGTSFTITDVLLIGDGDKITVGAPLVAKAKVVCNVVDHHKGDKIRVAKYKAKSRYRKVRGHRQALTSLEVTSIDA